MSDDFEDSAFEGGAQVEGDDLAINLADVEESSYEAIPAGLYPVEIAQLEYKLSASSGNPMWETLLRITDGEYRNRQLFFYFPFSIAAQPMTKAAIRQIAPELLEGPFKPKQVAESGDLIGRECMAKVKVENYQGEPRNKVAGLRALKDGEGLASF